MQGRAYVNEMQNLWRPCGEEVDGSGTEVAHVLVLSVRVAELTVVAEHSARQCLLGLADSLRAAGVPALPVKGDRAGSQMLEDAAGNGDARHRR
jgi:hypothetical protein